MPKRKYGQFKRKSPRMRKRRIVSTTRRRLFRRSTKVPRNLVDFGLAFPRRLKITHNYTENVVLTSTNSVPTYYFFSCNSMYDPNTTGIGHQPMFFDQAALLYNHYVVIASKIKVTAVPNSTNSGCAYMSLIQDDDTATTLDPINVSEMPATSIKLLAAGATNSVSMTNKFSAKKAFGGSVLANSNLRGTNAANIGDQRYWRLGLVEQAAVTNTQRVLVQITYIAIWFEQKELAQS